MSGDHVETVEGDERGDPDGVVDDEEGETDTHLSDDLSGHEFHRGACGEEDLDDAVGFFFDGCGEEVLSAGHCRDDEEDEGGDGDEEGCDSGGFFAFAFFGDFFALACIDIGEFCDHVAVEAGVVVAALADGPADA